VIGDDAPEGEARTSVAAEEGRASVGGEEARASTAGGEEGGEHEGEEAAPAEEEGGGEAEEAPAEEEAPPAEEAAEEEPAPAEEAAEEAAEEEAPAEEQAEEAPAAEEGEAAEGEGTKSSSTSTSHVDCGTSTKKVELEIRRLKPCPPKPDTPLALTWSNLNRFSKFFHYLLQYTVIFPELLETMCVTPLFRTVSFPFFAFRMADGLGRPEPEATSGNISKISTFFSFIAFPFYL